jgi:hypothetical protein
MAAKKKKTVDMCLAGKMGAAFILCDPAVKCKGHDAEAIGLARGWRLETRKGGVALAARTTLGDIEWAVFFTDGNSCYLGSYFDNLTAARKGFKERCSQRGAK